MANEYYRINVAGLQRDLPLCKLSDTMKIAAFVIVGDAELTSACARDLLAKAPEYDVIVTAETKGIPLAHEMARQSGAPRYIVARKVPKVYMRDVIQIEVNSITTLQTQRLILDGNDAEYMRGKRVLIVDDVVSTGESLKALEMLLSRVDCEIVGRVFILAEGDAARRADITYLAPLPLFDSEGNPI